MADGTVQLVVYLQGGNWMQLQVRSEEAEEFLGRCAEAIKLGAKVMTFSNGVQATGIARVESICGMQIFPDGNPFERQVKAMEKISRTHERRATEGDEWKEGDA